MTPLERTEIQAWTQRKGW